MHDLRPSDLKTILHSKRANLYYLQHCRVLVNGGRVEYVTDEGKQSLYWNNPIANTTTLLLGTGTSITQAAMRGLAKAGVMVGFCGGGGTPLSVCVCEADRLLQSIRRSQKPFTRACLWLLTDGRTLDSPPAPKAVDQVIVVDFDDPRLPIGRCASWAKQWRAEYRLGPQGT